AADLELVLRVARVVLGRERLRDLVQAEERRLRLSRGRSERLARRGRRDRSRSGVDDGGVRGPELVDERRLLEAVEVDLDERVGVRADRAGVVPLNAYVVPLMSAPLLEEQGLRVRRRRLRVRGDPGVDARVLD